MRKDRASQARGRIRASCWEGFGAALELLSGLVDFWDGDLGETELRRRDGRGHRQGACDEKNEADESRECGVPVFEQNGPIKGMVFGRAVFERLRRTEMRRPRLLKVEEKSATIDDEINRDQAGNKGKSQNGRRKDEAFDWTTPFS